MVVPMTIAAQSPLLAYRDAPYILSGIAGIAALCLLLVQPLLAVGLPGWPRASSARRLHRAIGAILLVAILVHVAGLYVTSPPDTIDALTLASPTPFSIYGVTAMWALIAAAAILPARRRFGVRRWRRVHLALALWVAVGTVAHAMLIEGTMGTISKAVLCVAVLASMATAVIRCRRGQRP